MSDQRGIMHTDHDVGIGCDFFPPGDAIGEYLGNHDVTVAIRARWQVEQVENHEQNGRFRIAGSRSRLLDWEVTGVSIDGRELRTDDDIPSDFQLQRVVNAVYSRKVREELESHGPEGRIIE